MKNRLWRAALFTVLALGVSVPAFAQTYAQQRWAISPLRFVNAATAGQTVSGFLPDSDYATGSAVRLDTTSAFPLNQCITQALNVPRAGTAVDSTDFIEFMLLPNGGGADPSTAADSLYLQTQVSLNGVTWTTLTPNIAFQAANTVNTTEIGGFVLEQNSTNCFARFYKTAWATTGQHQTALVGTAPTDNQMWGFPYIRWIVGWGATNCTGRYRAFVGHWTISDYQ